jgi:hypothetical protein
MCREVVIMLTDEQVAILKQPVNGQGGFQDLLRSIGERIERNQLALAREEVSRIGRYASDYGQGGFQDRLTVLLEAIEAAQ